MPAPLATGSLILTAPSVTGAVAHVRATLLAVELREPGGPTWRTVEPLALDRPGLWRLELHAAGTDGAQRTIRAVHAGAPAQVVEGAAVRVGEA